MLSSTADGEARCFPAEVHVRRRGRACRIAIDAQQINVACERVGIPKSVGVAQLRDQACGSSRNRSLPALLGTPRPKSL